MAKVLKSPAKYVQGANTLFEFDRYLQGMGKRLTVILSQGGVKRLQSTLEKTFAGKNFEVTYVVFQHKLRWNAFLPLSLRIIARQW